MTDSPRQKTILHDIANALAESGMIARGMVALDEGEYGKARTVVLIGNGGAAYWAQFDAWRRAQTGNVENPLDTWSRLVLTKAARHFNASVLLPNDKPFAPFQKWAMRAEKLKPSPLGLLIHPVFGLWHAYRGALLLEDEILIQEPDELIHPCRVCIRKPCLNSCPVDAFSASGFAYESCLSHVRGPDGGACRQNGCLARNACPVGAQWRYPAHMQAFHQKAFAGL